MLLLTHTTLLLRYSWVCYFYNKATTTTSILCANDWVFHQLVGGAYCTVVTRFSFVATFGFRFSVIIFTITFIVDVDVVLFCCYCCCFYYCCFVVIVDVDVFCCCCCCCNNCHNWIVRTVTQSRTQSLTLFMIIVIAVIIAALSLPYLVLLMVPIVLLLLLLHGLVSCHCLWATFGDLPSSQKAY